METTIYYFSGTGNTKFFADQVAKNLGECELVSISSIIDNKTIICEGRVGIFFPTYVWGLPEIVDRFMRKANLSKVDYLFMGATGGGSAGQIFRQAQRVLQEKKIKLNYGFFSKLPGNATNVYNAFSEEKCEELKLNSIDKAKEVTRNINNSVTTIEKFHFIFTFLHKVMYGGFIKALPTMDSNYIITNDCNGCGICEEVCPMTNIKMQSEKPQFMGSCQGCLACYNRCPEVAIHVKNDKLKKRYRYTI